MSFTKYYVTSARLAHIGMSLIYNVLRVLGSTQKKGVAISKPVHFKAFSLTTSKSNWPKKEGGPPLYALAKTLYTVLPIQCS